MILNIYGDVWNVTNNTPKNRGILDIVCGDV